MNDWDDKNNPPPEDDDDIFGWLDDDQDSAPSEPGDDDLSFEWQDAAEGDPSSGESDDDFSFDWEETPPEGETPRADEWRMQRPQRRESEFEQSMEEAEDADIGDVESILDWMADPDGGIEEPAAAEEPADLPDWLQGMEIPEASEEPPAATPEEPLSSDYEIDFSAGAADDDIEDDWLQDLAGTGALGSDEDDSDRLGQLATGELGGDDDFARLNQLAQTGELPDQDDDLSRLQDLATGELGEDEAAANGFEWKLGEGFQEDDDFQPIEAEPTGFDSAWDAGDFGEEDFASFGTADDTAEELPRETGSPWGDMDSFEEDFGSLEAADEPPQAGAFDTEALFGDMDFSEETPAEPSAAEEPDWLAGLDLPPDPDEEDEDEGTLQDALDALFATESDAAPSSNELRDEPERPGLGGEEPEWLAEMDLPPAEETPQAGSTLDDLLAELDAGDGDTEEVESLLSELSAEEDTPGALDDLLAEIGEESATEEPSTLDDLLAELDADDVVNVDEEQFAHEPPAAAEESAPLIEDDLFREEAEPGAEPADDLESLFADLGTVEDSGESDQEDAQLAEADWLSELDRAQDQEAAAAEGDFLDAEEWLQTLGDTEAVIPVTGDLEEEYGAVDLDADLFGDEGEAAAPADDLESLFADLGAVEEGEAEPEQVDLPDFGGDDVPDWLREAAASGTVGATSAVGQLRQQKDRPLDELDERLLDIRERGLELSTTDIEADTDLEKIESLVPNANEALIPVKRGGTASIITEPTLTPDQQQRAELLRGLVTATIGEGEEEAVQERRRGTRRGGILRGYKAGRLLIALVLLGVMALPFLTSEYNLAELPPGNFESGSQQEQAFLRVQSLMPQDPVLVAVEYGATGARELDTMTEALFSHLFNQGAVPILVSTDPVGLLNAENIAVDLAGEAERGVGFYSAGYLPGGELGIRDLNENLSAVIGSDSRGEVTDLPFETLDEFALIVLIAENSETVRQWMEQVAPVTETDFVVATGQSASPLAIPYVGSVDDAFGLLVGYEDAYTYQTMNVAFNGVPPTATPSPTPEPTEEPTEEVIVPPADATEEADETEEAAETEEPAATEEAAETEEAVATEPQPTETATSAPTNAPTATETATSEPTNTPTATATPAPRQFARIITTGAVNVRSGPGTDFDVVAGAVPGEELLVLGFNEAGDWVNVELPDGGDGWIATSLVEIFEEGEGETGILPRTFARRGRPVVAQQATPDEPVIQVGINVSGILMSVYDNPDFAGDPFAELEPNTEFLVLQQGDEVTQILLEDGRAGWVESRLLRVEERPLGQVEFAPTTTPTPTATPTATNTPTPTITSSPTATPFVPQVIPQTPTGANERWNAMTLGTLAAMVLIFGGNVIWIIRWLRQRGK